MLKNNKKTTTTNFHNATKQQEKEQQQAHIYAFTNKNVNYHQASYLLTSAITYHIRVS